MERKELSKFFSPIIVSLLILGALSIGLSQYVVTTSSTTVITVPGTTFTTVISKPGTTKTVTITHGGYRLIYVEMRPNQECVMVIEATPVAEVTFPGAAIPGTTATYTVPASTYETTLTRIEGGATSTTTRPEIVEQVLTTGMPPVVMTLTVAAPVYGRVVEYCELITITVINRIEASEAATIVLALPGFTFKGTVVKLPTLFITQPVTTTKTTTKTGTTYTRTIERTGQTLTKTITVPGTVVTKTVEKPGKLITSAITYTTTLPQSPGKTPPPKPPKKTTQPPKPPKRSETTEAQPAQELPPSMLLVIIAAMALIVAAAAIILLSRKRGEGAAAIPSQPPPPPLTYSKQ